MRKIIYRVYFAVLVTAALALLVRGTPTIESVAWPTIVMWVALMTLTEIAPIRLPGGGVITVSSVLDYAGIIVFGPYVTAWVDVFSTITGRVLLRRRRPLYKSVFNMALFVVTSVVAGELFQAAGGQVGRLDLPRHFLAVAVMGIAYFLVNTIGVSFVISLTTGERLARIWGVNFRWTIFHLLAFVPFGCIVALLYLELGYLGVLLFMFPVLLARYSFKLYTEMRQDFFDFVETLTRVIEEVDPYTRHHSHRVSRYARQIAEAIRLPSGDVETIATAALLHDLGKVSYRTQDIIDSPNQLTSDQKARMIEHPDIGAEIVGSVRVLRSSAECVRCHHERWDGTGYPRRMRGEEIPIGARILMVADSLDAMTSDRPYRRALSLERAVEELRRGAGRQFDPAVVGAVERLHAEAKLVTLYRSSAEAEDPPPRAIGVG